MEFACPGRGYLVREVWLGIDGMKRKTHAQKERNEWIDGI